METGGQQITVNLGNDEFLKFSERIEEVFLDEGIVLSSEEGEKYTKIKKIIEMFIKDVINTSSEYEIESFVGKQLSQGDITRMTNIFNNSESKETNTTNIYSFKEMNENFIKKYGYQLYDDNIHIITTTNDIKEKKKIILELLKDTKEEKNEIIYSAIQQNCYPIEILQELGIEIQDLPSYMIDISQAMKMIHTHKVHTKYGMEGDNIENIFVVKRIDRKPAFLRISKGDKRRYFIDPLYSNDHPHREIKAGARFFLKIPNID